MCLSYCRHYNSNVHRGVHYLSAKATTAYEDARGKVARFINAASDREIVFTRNASEAINLVAQTWGMDNIKQGDEVRAGGAGSGSRGLNSKISSLQEYQQLTGSNGSSSRSSGMSVYKCV
jgi:hypothetical protein